MEHKSVSYVKDKAEEITGMDLEVLTYQSVVASTLEERDSIGAATVDMNLDEAEDATVFQIFKYADGQKYGCEVIEYESQKEALFERQLDDLSKQLQQVINQNT